MPRIPWAPAEIETFERELAKRPHFASFNHVSLSVHDLDVAKKFYTDVLGGRLVNDGTPHFAEVLVAGTIIGLSDTRGKPQAPDAEFPHIAFTIESEHFMPMIELLQAHGVKTHAPWTRHHIEGLMYFKDPSGNLIEIYCPEFSGAKELQQAPTPLDVVELPALDYTWPA